MEEKLFLNSPLSKNLSAKERSDNRLAQLLLEPTEIYHLGQVQITINTDQGSRMVEINKAVYQRFDNQSEEHLFLGIDTKNYKVYLIPCFITDLKCLGQHALLKKTSMN